MADLFDYLLWRGDLTLDTVPLNPVDTLILSELSYLGFEGLVPGDFQHPVPLKVAAQAFLALPDREERLHLKKDLELISACAETERFGDLRMLFYRNELLPAGFLGQEHLNLTRPGDPREDRLQPLLQGFGSCALHNRLRLCRFMGRRKQQDRQADQDGQDGIFVCSQEGIDSLLWYGSIHSTASLSIPSSRTRTPVSSCRCRGDAFAWMVTVSGYPSSPAST